MRPQTLGELKESGYRARSVKDELRENLIARLREGEEPFPGIFGYEHTVLPMLHNAILARHDVILLGLRGQAKTRLLRSLVNLLDEWLPAIAGSEVNESPFEPITAYGRRILAERGDETPVAWIPRSERYREKLATPDVTIADLIGDIDPIKAATQKRTYSDEEIIHYGIVPRTNRGIFAINELPDLQPRIQVGLLNILEERDLQIRGFPVRIPLDILLVFSANPEDYTNRGNIITPLKDRISSQILTHYPDDVKTARAITEQEAWTERAGGVELEVPEYFKELVEKIAFAARQSEFVDQSSGVSARMPISALEILCSNLERRGILRGENRVFPRLCDLLACLPAITGKVEVVYEGEQQGTEVIAKKLIAGPVGDLFKEKFPPVDSGRRTERARSAPPPEDADEPSPRGRSRFPAEEPDKLNPVYRDVVDWFGGGNRIDVSDESSFADHERALESVPGLRRIAEEHFKPSSREEAALAMELVLEGLTQSLKIAREDLDSKVSYKEMLKFNLVRQRTPVS
ncbi:MAG TPA: magnesium chelatase [Thermoanaerobaculia bacterium]|nr:magnesium chelatase [Thermoanaerobaculia bacterium]